MINGSQQEKIPPKEEADIRQMLEVMRSFMDKTYGTGKMLRHFHPKAHGIVAAEFIVEDGLPVRLRKGLFKTPASYKAWIRFSNAPPRIQSDKRASGRGMAIKILDPPGELLHANADGSATQDFLMTTSPVLSPGTVANYCRAIKALVYGFPRNLAYILDPCNWPRLALTLRYMKKHANLLELQYFTGSPVLFGAGGPAAKFSAIPRTTRRSRIPKDAGDHFLRDRLVEDLSREDYRFDFCVQFQTDIKREPVENTARIWRSPFVKVATIVVTKQEFSTLNRERFGENLVFSPWQCLAGHRPLGGINRARKTVYEALSAYRKNRNDQVEAANFNHQHFK